MPNRVLTRLAFALGGVIGSAGAAIVILLPLSFFPVRRRLRALRGRCPKCGYDRIGLDGPCPECGTGWVLTTQQRTAGTHCSGRVSSNRSGRASGRHDAIQVREEWL